MKLVESIQIVHGFGPVDMQTADNAGDWVNLAEFDHCMVVFKKKAGTAGDDPTLHLEQATVAAGSDAKALTFDRIYTKQGADLTVIPNFTEVANPGVAGDFSKYTDATSAEVAAIWVVEFDAEQLDADGGFTFLRASVADIGSNAQLGTLDYYLSRGRRQGKVANIASAIS